MFDKKDFILAMIVFGLMVGSNVIQIICVANIKEHRSPFVLERQMEQSVKDVSGKSDKSIS